MSCRSQSDPYFKRFNARIPPERRVLSPISRAFWQLSAGATIGFSMWYLHWRWTSSLNPDALVFSSAVALTESLCFLGLVLFYFDIWDEADTPQTIPPKDPKDCGVQGHERIGVDVFVTTYDEVVDVVEPTLLAATRLKVPANMTMSISLLDDGARPEMSGLADAYGAQYLPRTENRGFKAGNLKQALFATDGDFVVICDADTQLFPDFLQETMGYFRDPKVSWVQTPHWFFDLPEGVDWNDILPVWLGKTKFVFAKCLQFLTGRTHVGEDVFLSDPGFFFDVVQRRRNRNGASFCCGAGSIHRREAIFDSSLTAKGDRIAELTHENPIHSARSALKRLEAQPFCFHVSEDILTSIQQHQNGWRSVYHPKILARMLSPWSPDAWAAQKLKYAGGTFDIMLRHAPLRSKNMPWRMKLHYGATFSSYLSILIMPVLLLSPVVSLLLGVAPVDVHAFAFFLHLLPVLIANEIALNFASKGENIYAGRILAFGTIAIQLRALAHVLIGKRPKFRPTPKLPKQRRDLRHAVPILAVLALFAVASIFGVVNWALGTTGYSQSFVLINVFWLCWTSFGLLRVAVAASAAPARRLENTN